FKVFAAIIPSEVIALSNAERREAGLPMLSENAVLDQVAQAKADDMATEGYFSHTSPSGVTPWDWFREAKYEYRYAGENLAIHFHDATSQERAWMESKKHCENILSPKYREIGVAVREMTWEGRRTTVAVQSFGTQMRDENTLNLTETGRVVCPKVFPSVLGSSMPSDTHGGVIGAVTTFLSDTATQYKIDTVRLLLLLLIALMQTAGLMTVLSLATHDRWLRKW
ncbi:MAG: CAP domain-containing protein, partial [Candidatus Moraniibacteriota bacterium]